MSEHESQSSYQVRFDWGDAGRAAISPDAEAVVWVDELDGGADARTLADAAAVAEWALAEQERLGGRFRIAVVAAGVARPDGSVRFAVEDLLAAGAIIEAIAGKGIDHQSPEAAAAASAYVGLRTATKHLVSASVSGRERKDREAAGA